MSGKSVIRPLQKLAASSQEAVCASAQNRSVQVVHEDSSTAANRLLTEAAEFPKRSNEAVFKICIPNTLQDSFDYQAGTLDLIAGMRVSVPFRNGQKVGIVLSKQKGSAYFDKLKPISAILDEKPLLPASILDLCLWVAEYYQSPLAQVLRLAIPKNLRLAKPMRTAKKQECARQDPSKDLMLNEAQAFAVNSIKAELGFFKVFLLHGVTGSGKTEVYLQAIKPVLEKNQQVLVIVPEIGLTPQLVGRFKNRFQVPIATLHSQLTEAERAKTWLKAAEGEAKIIIGTRSAVFTPLPQLGLIIIDEEHDASLKQMEGVRYSARDTAIMRALSANIPIVLGSATPSLESLHNCMNQKYSLLQLKERALSKNRLHFDLIDIRNQKLQYGLAPQTIKTIQTHLDAENQVLVFINQRGFAPILFCASCTLIQDCPQCDAHFTVHKKKNQLICHHCGLVKTIPNRCANCQKEDLVPLGIGTQRLFESLETLFPHTKMLRIDRDSVQKKGTLASHLEQIADGKTQLIVGTQMLAKGHDFPNLSLVVIVNTDAGFFSPDFKATEQIGQLITQVSGRAGRADKPGQVILQTALPHHPLLNVLIQKGYHAFSETLLATRKEAFLPPFYYLAMVRAEHKQLEKLTLSLGKIKKALANYPLTILGPAPAPLARKANMHRMQLLIKSQSRQGLQKALQETRLNINQDKEFSGFYWHIDVDPINLD